MVLDRGAVVPGGPRLPQDAFAAQDLLFYVAVASLIMPSIIVSLGIGLRVPPARRRRQGAGALDATAAEGYTTAMGLFTSGLGAHLTWTLPFGLLIMFAVFNRFNPRLRGSRARPRRHAAGRSSATWCCRSSCRRWSGVGAVRLHPVLGRDRALEPGDRRPQHAAARAAGPDHHRDHAGDLRAGHRHDRCLLRGHPLGAPLVHLLERRQARRGSDAGKGLV